jgi:hypothetical protein
VTSGWLMSVDAGGWVSGTLLHPSTIADTRHHLLTPSTAPIDQLNA